MNSKYSPPQDNMAEIIECAKRLEALCEQQPDWKRAAVASSIARDVRLLRAKLLHRGHHFDSAEAVYLSCCNGSRFDHMEGLDRLLHMLDWYPEIDRGAKRRKKYRAQLIQQYQDYVDYMLTCPGKDNPFTQSSIREYREKIFQETR